MIDTATRRGFLAGATALVVTVGGGVTRAYAADVKVDAPPENKAPSATPPSERLQSWLKILPTGTVEAYSGKVDLGMGITTAFAQIVAEELDVPFERVRMIMGDSATTPDQGGIGSSTSIQYGAMPLRSAAAEARRLLVGAAAAKLGVPAETLTTSNGAVHAGGQTVKYTELLDALAVADTLTIKPNPVLIFQEITSAATPKDPKNYKIVGRSYKRGDISQKVFAQFRYITDVRVPGMMHARVIRPPQVGASLVSVNEASIKGIGDARAVRNADFLAVVASREWDAIKAMRTLKATWSTPAPAFGNASSDNLESVMWASTPMKSMTTLDKNGAADKLAASNNVVQANYYYAYQSHASMDPGCAVADVRADGVTLWSGTQKPHQMTKGIGELLGMPADKVHVIFVQDAGSYGRNGYDDTAGDAALISKLVGKPVRVQWMRNDMTQWGNKGPAFVAKMRGTTKDGAIDAFDVGFRAYNAWEIFPYPDTVGNFLAGQLIGKPNTKAPPIFPQYGAESPAYDIATIRATSELLKPLAPNVSPLRGALLRDPDGPGATFAVESFMDELAAQAHVDPVKFRLAHLSDPRHREVLQAAADRAKWGTGTRKKWHGRGVAFALRGKTIVATVADVVVDPKNGHVRVTRLVCAHDCGLIVNPQGLRNTVEANMVQSMSRALFEETMFTPRHVTSVDWRTYPVAHVADIPKMDIVLLNRPTLAPTGAGEPATRTTAAAIANAVNDATGARVRTIPLTPKRVLAAIHGHTARATG